MNRTAFGIIGVTVAALVVASIAYAKPGQSASPQSADASLQRRVTALENDVRELKAELAALRAGVQPQSSGGAKFTGTWVNAKARLAMSVAVTEWKQIEFVSATEVNAMFSNGNTHLYTWRIVSDRIVFDTTLFSFTTDGKTLTLTDSAGLSGTFVKK